MQTQLSYLVSLDFPKESVLGGLLHYSFHAFLFFFDA